MVQTMTQPTAIVVLWRVLGMGETGFVSQDL